MIPCNIQEMSVEDPRKKTEDYLQKHGLKDTVEVLALGSQDQTQQMLAKLVVTFLQGLISELLYNKPANPKQFIVDYLEKIKVAGTKPLLTQDDLKIMFGMCKSPYAGARAVCSTEKYSQLGHQDLFGTRHIFYAASTESNSSS